MIVETRATVSRRYYEKRNRAVCEQAIEEMSKVLNKGGVPIRAANLRDMEKSSLITLALTMHADMPDD